MSRLQIGFDNPSYLMLLVVLLPAVWLLSRNSLSRLGTVRWLVATLLRTAVVLLIVLVVLGPQRLPETVSG